MIILIRGRFNNQLKSPKFVHNSSATRLAKFTAAIRRG